MVHRDCTAVDCDSRYNIAILDLWASERIVDATGLLKWLTTGGWSGLGDGQCGRKRSAANHQADRECTHGDELIIHYLTPPASGAALPAWCGFWLESSVVSACDKTGGPNLLEGSTCGR